jgi:hypothetical protein
MRIIKAFGTSILGTAQGAQAHLMHTSRRVHTSQEASRLTDSGLECKKYESQRCLRQIFMPSSALAISLLRTEGASKPRQPLTKSYLSAIDGASSLDSTNVHKLHEAFMVR